MIIGIAGTLGAGKGTVVEYLKAKGFAHYSASSILRELVKEKGLPGTRENLSHLAEELLVDHSGGILNKALERAELDGAKDFILEAIHRMSEADFVRSAGGKILGVDADIHIRFERSVARKDGEKDDVTFEQFKEHSEREDEGRRSLSSHIRSVIETADVVLLNNGTVEELYTEADHALQKLRGG